ncbi:4-diphosphocytidyl-2C-methyl-D-erythritol kinase [Thermophilibacter sp. ET337]|uniref:4-(cytidine 5'-diphospho)-2-C-methyl-D-erythritol kinase n=1 Tax=Thermophilibacter sp. ET337 TaxID=2973084 RepID=UPI0021AC8B75|nr:4-diphosphocytidyl-2C-methyl-D-erythritol kinase [Thermophilibacter sp. ET337]MCR8908277.1 4-diphosphocytidyl-2C-methyl-D-erythritol kinase [Thermophilibacter sp. ET337]
MGATVVTTPCKVNLYLGVHAEKDERGYHRVDSVMVPVALCDTVSVSDAPELSVSFDPPLSIPAEKTGVWRAAALLAEALGVEPRVRIDVCARIPERAGLGGSSADAGATLRALATLWGVSPLDPRVIAVARRVGADVPFFLDPRPALFSGAGDVRARSFPAVEMPLVLVMPRAEGGSTVEAYAEFDRSGERPVAPEPLCAALASGSVAAMAARLHNNLAPAARALCPEAGVVESWLRAQPGVLGAQVSGSGTCSFAICDGVGTADELARRAEECGWRAWSTKTVGFAGGIC